MQWIRVRQPDHLFYEIRWAVIPPTHIPSKKQMHEICIAVKKNSVSTATIIRATKTSDI